MKPTLNMAVRDLVSFVLRSGDLDLTTFGVSSMSDGIYAHQEIQDSRPPEYSAEVPVSHVVETDRYFLEVGGRMDGLYLYPDRVIVDEIKSTKKDLSAVVQAEDELHWAQAKCYAYFYAIQQGLERIEIQLTYFNLDTEETAETRRSFALNDLKRFFDSIFVRYKEWADRVYDHIKARDRSSLALGFPFTSFRKGQEDIMREVGTAIEQGAQIFVQAPTGIGKTLAIIFPAIKAISRGEAEKVFYLTARTTGRVAAESTLELLKRNGLYMKSISLVAKEKLCFNPDKLCNGQECEFARGFYDRVNAALKEAYHIGTLTRETIIEITRKHKVCPFEFSLELSLWVDFIICDYNYVFDPRVYLKRFFDESDRSFIVLVDEAHNLVDRAREMYSAELLKGSALLLRRLVKGKLADVYRSLGKINSWMVKAQKQYCAEHNETAEKEAPNDLAKVLESFIACAAEWLAQNRQSDFREQLLEYFFESKSFLRTIDIYGKNYVTCYVRTEEDFKTKLFCIDPAPHLTGVLKRCRTVVFFSATLNPMPYFIESLGGSSEAATLSLPSPFDSDNLRVLVAGRISTLYRHRDWTKLKVAEAISILIEQRKGNYIAFFPSYEYMKMVHEIFVRLQPGVETLIQSSQMTEPEREVFLRSFDRSGEKSLIGFAVMGGAFAESIDLLGEKLAGAAIIGVGMPPVSLERELIREYFNTVDESGFAFAYQYPGMIKVLQAAGRVIRSETDRGVILLIDTRFTGEPYASLLPREWNPLEVENITRIRTALKQFWQD